MGLAVGGLASGLDTDSIISKLSELQRQPIVKLQRREADYQVQLTKYGGLQGLLSTFQSAATALKDPAGLTSFSATSGNSELFTASAGSTAAAGTYNVKISQLAQNQKLKSIGFATNTEAIGAGTLHLRVGSAAVTDIAVTDTNTLTDVAKAINAAKAGVTATVVFDGTAHSLTLTANDTGAANVIKLTATDIDGNDTDITAGLSRLVYDAGAGGTKNLSQTQTALDATIEVDGVTGITRSSNTISDVIPGVTLTLKSQPAPPDNASTLTVSRDTAGLKGKIDAFIKGYNDLVNFFKKEQSFDTTTKQAGSLLGDSTTNLIRHRLAGLLDTSVPGLPSGFSRLRDLGITSDAKGLLVRSDTTKLDSAMASDFDAVSRFFTQTTTGSEGFAVRLGKTLDDFLVTDRGLLSSRQKGISKDVDRLHTQMERYETRVSASEVRLRAQFNSLESLLSRYKSTGDFLSQQIGSMQNLNAAIANQ
jgi:flagellar hook-associated protein 2